MTSTITTVFSAISFFGLTVVSVWFASERTVFSRHKGRKWLYEILDDVSTSGYKWVKETAPAFTWSTRVIQSGSIPLRRMNAMFSRSSVGTRRTDGAEFVLPPHRSPTVPPGMGVITPRSNPACSTESLDRPQPGNEGRYSGKAGARPADAFPIAPSIASPSPPKPGPEMSAARVRFRNLARSAVMVNRLIGLGDEAKAKVSMPPEDYSTPGQQPLGAPNKPRGSRVAGLVPRLQNMAPTQDIAAHTALVRHMQVSA